MDTPQQRTNYALVNAFLKYFGAFDEAYIGRRFSEFLSELVLARYPAVELPPLSQ